MWAKVSDALDGMPSSEPFGRPYLTAYQLAIKIDEAWPQLKDEFGGAVGGAGIGRHNSLAEYLAGQLTERIRRGDIPIPVERAALSDYRLAELAFKDASQYRITSSLTGANDVSMFRLTN